jgi:hypothetical protein
MASRKARRGRSPDRPGESTTGATEDGKPVSESKIGGSGSDLTGPNDAPDAAKSVAGSVGAPQADSAVAAASAAAAAAVAAVNAAMAAGAAARATHAGSPLEVPAAAVIPAPVEVPPPVVVPAPAVVPPPVVVPPPFAAPAAAAEMQVAPVADVGPVPAPEFAPAAGGTLPWPTPIPGTPPTRAQKYVRSPARDVPGIVPVGPFQAEVAAAEPAMPLLASNQGVVRHQAAARPGWKARIVGPIAAVLAALLAAGAALGHFTVVPLAHGLGRLVSIPANAAGGWFGGGDVGSPDFDLDGNPRKKPRVARIWLVFGGFYLLLALIIGTAWVTSEINSPLADAAATQDTRSTPYVAAGAATADTSPSASASPTRGTTQGPTAKPTPVPAATPTPPSTPTPVATPTPPATPTPKTTPAPTPKPTGTPTPKPTPTPTPKPTPTPAMFATIVGVTVPLHSSGTGSAVVQSLPNALCTLTWHRASRTGTPSPQFTIASNGYYTYANVTYGRANTVLYFSATCTLAGHTVTSSQEYQVTWPAA